MLSVRLDSGTLIYLDAFYAWATYSEMVKPWPSTITNEYVLNAAKERIENMWPTPLATLGEEDYFLAPELPAVTAAGLFVCSRPVKERNADVSHLVVLWMQETLYPLLDDANEKLLKRLPWENLAEDHYC
jgi:hypothetical protein